MLDDFFTRALVAGIGIALIAGPLGCFVVWRRMSYFGDTMAHAALLGVALALVAGIPVIGGVFAVALAVSLALIALQDRNTLPADALLGILSHSTLALGLVLISFMSSVRIDLMGLLFGDILAVSEGDIAVIWLGGGAIMLALAAIWRPLLAATVSVELAEAEGLAPGRARLVFMVLMASVIAMAMKIVGVVLITALLIVPAAAARRFARTPERMAMVAALVGAVAVTAGLTASLQFDAPSGPAIVVAAFVLFLAGLAPGLTGGGARADRRGQR
jgi:zinc transport system permease protein